MRGNHVKINPQAFVDMKGNQRIPMLTAYTFPVAASIESAGIPIILVGDTVGLVEMGFSTTRDVTIEHIEYHLGAVRRRGRIYVGSRTYPRFTWTIDNQ